MITSKILSKIKDSDLKENLVTGLAEGLATGLVGGLAWGLVTGLVAGLAWGLAAGLVAGLAWGLAAGLVMGLAWGLAAGLASSLVNYADLHITIPLWFLLLLIFVASNIINFCLKDSKKISRMRFFLEKEVLGFVEVSAIVFNFLAYKEILSTIDFSKYIPVIVQWIGYIGIDIGIGILIIGAVWAVFEEKYRLYTWRNKK